MEAECEEAQCQSFLCNNRYDGGGLGASREFQGRGSLYSRGGDFSLGQHNNGAFPRAVQAGGFLSGQLRFDLVPGNDLEPNTRTGIVTAWNVCVHGAYSDWRSNELLGDITTRDRAACHDARRGACVLIGESAAFYSFGRPRALAPKPPRRPEGGNREGGSVTCDTRLTRCGCATRSKTQLLVARGTD